MGRSNPAPPPNVDKRKLHGAQDGEWERAFQKALVSIDATLRHSKRTSFKPSRGSRARGSGAQDSGAQDSGAQGRAAQGRNRKKDSRAWMRGSRWCNLCGLFHHYKSRCNGDEVQGDQAQGDQAQGDEAQGDEDQSDDWGGAPKWFRELPWPKSPKSPVQAEGKQSVEVKQELDQQQELELPYNGSYECAICFNSVRCDEKVLYCTRCTGAQPWHEKCAGTEWLTTCPQHCVGTVAEWKGPSDMKSRKSGAAGKKPSSEDVINLVDSGDEAPSDYSALEMDWTKLPTSLGMHRKGACITASASLPHAITYECVVIMKETSADHTKYYVTHREEDGTIHQHKLPALHEHGMDMDDVAVNTVLRIQDFCNPYFPTDEDEAGGGSSSGTRR